MWLAVSYQPTSLFSLKMSKATNSAGKSLPVPSPYAVKMALLNAIITYGSLKTAKNNFSLIRDLELRFSLPKQWVVNNCMLKIFKMKRNEYSSTEKEELRKREFSNEEIKRMEYERKIRNPFQSTVAFREYVYLSNTFKIAVNVKNKHYQLSDEELKFLTKWFMHIYYFGKKGCFVQFIGFEVIPELPDSYSKILDDSIPFGIMFPLDDVEKSKKTSFENMSNYSTEKNAKRIQQIHVFPFRQKAANKNFTMYERI